MLIVCVSVLLLVAFALCLAFLLFTCTIGIALLGTLVRCVYIHACMYSSCTQVVLEYLSSAWALCMVRIYAYLCTEH